MNENDNDRRAAGGNKMGVPEKPAPGDFLPPVAWLFGREFIATLKWVLLYVAFRGKLDPRDWMKVDPIPAAGTQAEVDKFWRQWNAEWLEEEDGAGDSAKEFWFDYISDTGDGQRAVYSIAYLCMSDLAVPGAPEPNAPAEFVEQPDRAVLERDGKMLLPRGTFLFVGGDTSYHISDYATLAERFQNPFVWAYRDLRGRAQSASPARPRLLFGIPGNHDYYDALDGFNRQFRRPSTGEDVKAGERPPSLAIPSFERLQEGSYLALRLPFGWWMWGMDTEAGEIDFRQWEFFRGIQDEHAPNKLILATPEPTTVFGKYATADESQSKTFAALGLERPYLKGAPPLADGKCRVDLSGDIHHYARYWGPADSSQSDNYASVVSGGGGAFLHPTQTDVKEVQPRPIYPDQRQSRERVADEIFKVWNIVKGGYVWLFGLIIAFAITFTTLIPQSGRDAVTNFRPFQWLGITEEANEQQRSQPPLSGDASMPARTRWAGTLYSSAASLAASLALLGAVLFYSSRLFKKEYDPTWEKRRKPSPGERLTVPRGKRLVLWALVLAAFAALSYGLWGFHSREADLATFMRSFIILAALAWLVLAVIESLWYSEWLFEEAHTGEVKWRDYLLIWALLVAGLLGLVSALWLFGSHESSLLASDLALLLIVLGGGGGLTYFAYSTGGKLKKGGGKFAFLLLGVSHALLQLGLPFLMVRKGHLLYAPLATIVVIIVFKYVGRWLVKLETGWPLALAWLAFGAVLLLIPFLLDRPVVLPEERWTQLLLCAYAGAFGAAISCVLFGWYLAVALAFNGHNNEAGGAARIEGFKQLIRFRINRDGLTGFVIGVDTPNSVGGPGSLDPQVIDVFHLAR